MMGWNKKKDVFALMVGHGRSINGSWDPGCAYKGCTEAELMLPIVKAAAKYLRSKGIKVLTDADTDNNRNMISCVQWANNQRARLYMSIHCDYLAASAGVYPLYISTTGKAMARSVGKAVAKSMNMKLKKVQKRSDLYELTHTDMPAVVFETGAIKADLKNLKQSRKYGEALGKAIYDYIMR